MTGTAETQLGWNMRIIELIQGNEMEEESRYR
jgi:hypothetical protein